jgi:hypothetical protein
MAGVTYLIGTKEYFTPKVNGYIQPVSDASGGAAGTSGPRMQVNMINHGSEKTAQASQPRFDRELKSWVVNIWLEDMAQNGPIRQTMGSMR